VVMTEKHKDQVRIPLPDNWYDLSYSAFFAAMRA